jgi:hypothetical protein
MRPPRATFIVLVTFAALATAAYAKNDKAQKQSEETAASSDCHAYQMSADGNWVALPCLEDGAAKSTHQRNAPKVDHDEGR